MLKLAFDGIHMANVFCSNLVKYIFEYKLSIRNWGLLSKKTQKVDGLGTLDRQSQSTAPDKLSQRTQSTAHTERYGVVQGLLEAVVVEEDTGGGIDVGVGVLSLSLR